MGGKRKSTPSFTHTWRLNLDAHQREVLDQRFHAALHLYNTALAEASSARGECASPASTNAHARPKLPPNVRLCSGRRTAFGLYDLFPFVGELGHREIGRHLDVGTARGIAKRAYDAVNDWVADHRGRPQFTSPGQVNPYGS